MATAAVQDQNQLLQNAIHNASILQDSERKYLQLTSNQGGTSPNLALGESYSFYLQNTSAYIDMFRIWFYDVEVVYTPNAGSVQTNRGGIWTILGNLRIALGNHVYKVRASAIPLLLSTIQKHGWRWHDPGNETYNYSYELYGSSNGGTTSQDMQYTSGTNTFTGYLDIPVAFLQMVKDADGLMPTLSNSGVSVEFTTISALAGADAYRYPANVSGGATLALGATPGVVEVYARVLTQTTVFTTTPLAAPIAGPAFVFEENPYNLQSTAPTFYTFQGQSAESKLVKAIIIINNPGEVAGEFSTATAVSEFDLYYDASKETWRNATAENPFSIANFLADQRAAYGDLPPGVLVLDWSRGTDAEYPNNHGYLDLNTYKNAGFRLTYGNAPQTGAQVIVLPFFLNPTLYEAQS